MSKFSCLFLLFFIFPLRAQELKLSIGDLFFLSPESLREIKSFVSELKPEEYELKYFESELILTLKGSPSLEIMGYEKTKWVEPFWGLLDGYIAYDLRETNSEAIEFSIKGFNCIQKRFPQESDGRSYYIYRARLYATAISNASRLIEIVRNYNICSKSYPVNNF